MILKQQSGQTLLEVIAAVSIAALVALGLFKVTSSSVSNSRFSKDQSEATSIVQREFNNITAYKETNGSDFWANRIDKNPVVKFDQGFCYRLATTSADLGDPAKLMAAISIDIFWDQKTNDANCSDINNESSSCCNTVGHGNTNFEHNLHFDTYVTN